MKVIDITDQGVINMLMAYFASFVEKGGPFHSIRVGIDPMDNGLKFSVDYGTWSPPLNGNVTD